MPTLFNGLFSRTTWVSRHQKSQTKASPGAKVWQTSNLRPLRLGEEKKERRRRKKKKDRNHRAKYNGLP